jgi:cytochrome c oxidase assembly protein subunit 15
LAYFVTTLILAFRIICCKFSLTKPVIYAINALIIVVALQVSLGVATILYHVPVALASLHQIFALLLFTVIIFITNELKGECRVQSSESGKKYS